MIYLLYISILVASLLLTYFVKKLALKKNVIDIPNERSSHSAPTPRGGGLAIVICYFIGLVVLFIKGEISETLFYALLSGVILGIIGILDDMFSLKPYIRFVFQIIASVIALYFLGGLKIHTIGIENKLILLLINVFIIFGIVWFINLFNFLDGIDAYASLEAIFVSFALYLFIGAPVFLIVIFSVLGFLIWNWPKAKIFMGDVGSTQLGFILAIVGIYYHNQGDLPIIFWLIFTSLFWFDATITLIRRYIYKEKLGTAHKKHAYQRYVQAGNSHLKTSLSALTINMLILFLLWGSMKIGINSYIFLGINVFFLTLIYIFIERKFPFPKENV